MKKSFYQPELDALRFFAFSCVFVTHCRLPAPFDRAASAGAFGMCVFFVLSSYLIFTILLVEREATGGVDLKRFYVRRILRIWPLYFAVLIFVLLWMRYSGEMRITRHAMIACTFLMGNLYVIKTGWALGPANALWSLSVEEQFYAVIALISRVRLRTVVVVCCATVLCSYAVLVWLARLRVVPHVHVWPNSFVQFQFFALGALLALVLYKRPLKISTTSRVALWLFGLSAWFIAAYSFPLTGDVATSAWKLVCGFALAFIGTAAIFLGTLNTTLRFPPALLYLGKISYGLYMFHYLFLWNMFYYPPTPWVTRLHLSSRLVGGPVAFLLTVTTAALSYRFFEKPILRLKQRFETVSTRSA